ncbi:MAG: glycosyltransferase [Planctomycetota bacterium]
MTKQTAPPIAVLLPVCNAEAFLREAIASVLSQSFDDFELLALNDGSTDGSKRILDEFAQHDPRVTVIHRENRGLVETLNELIDRTRAPLLARMDADDICLPGRFERQHAHMQAHTACACVGGAIELIDDAGSPLRTPPTLLNDSDIQRAALSGRTPLCHPAVMMRRDAVIAAGKYQRDTFPAEDLDLFLRLGELGQLANVPDSVLRYRMHDNSVSVTQSDRQRAQIRRVCRAAHRRRGVAWSSASWIEGKPEQARGCPVAANPTASALASHG